MDFSVTFFAFLTITILLFYGVRPKKMRPYVLLCASLLFIAHLSPSALIAILTAAATTYVMSLIMVRLGKSGLDKWVKAVYVFSVILAVGNLFLHKYAYWLLCRMFKIEGLYPYLNELVIPLGLSFYTFQIIDYLTRVYKKEDIFTYNPLELVLYLTYFPKIMSGPIERADSFKASIGRLTGVKLFDEGRVVSAVTAVLLGFFMKIVIADRALLFTQKAFLYPEYFGGGALALASLIYTIEIYADFAGYSLIAVGVSKFFGIDLVNNFDAPYFSENITEFWRRWHISLGSFLKDYIYIPLGGNRKGNMRQYLNLAVVFIICGLWHGAAVRFIFWGFLHALFSVASRWALKKNIKFLVKGISGRIITFCLVSFAWIFFASEYFRGAVHFIKCMFTSLTHDPFGGYKLYSEVFTEFWVLLVMTVLLFVFEYIAYKKGKCLYEYIAGANHIVRYVFWYVLIMIIFVMGIYGTEVGNAQFIYMYF